MKAERKIYTVEEICKGFTYNEAEGKGLFGLSGRLTIQPEYQRNYLYAEQNGAREIAVIESVLKGNTWSGKSSVKPLCNVSIEK